MVGGTYALQEPFAHRTETRRVRHLHISEMRWQTREASAAGRIKRISGNGNLISQFGGMRFENNNRKKEKQRRSTAAISPSKSGIKTRKITAGIAHHTSAPAVDLEG